MLHCSFSVSFEIKNVSTPTFLFQYYWKTLLGSLHFYMNFRSAKKGIVNLIEFASKMYIALGSIAIFAVVGLPIHR